MSVIFPTEPAKVNIHLLPKDAEMFTYRVADDLKISAWMPDGFQRVEQSSAMTNDDFYHENCEDCSRNSYYFLEDYKDEDGDVDWDNPDLEGHCNVYDNGYYGQNCPLGRTKQDYEASFDVSNMVFEIHLTHLGPLPRFVYTGDSAYLQAARLNEDGVLEATDSLMAANVFGDADYPERICWGYNQKPNNLREMVTYFFTTPFNNDLTPIEAFEENCGIVQRESANDYNYSTGNLFSGEKYLTGSADALMLLDAEADIQAFFTMLMAGFKPLEKAPHVMMIPLVEYEFKRSGNTYRGYKTIEDFVGKSWFISNVGEDKGLLVGQL